MPISITAQYAAAVAGGRVERDPAQLAVVEKLARLEGECIFAALARKVDRIELIGEPETAINMAAHGYDELPIRLHPA